MLTPRQYRRTLRCSAGPFVAIWDLLVGVVVSLTGWLYLYTNTPPAERTLLELKAIGLGVIVVVVMETARWLYRRYHVTPYEHYKQLYGEMEADKTALARARQELMAMQDSRPRVRTWLDHTGEAVTLVVFNEGGEGTFYAQLNVTGASVPNKRVFGRWEHLLKSKDTVIATGTDERLRLLSIIWNGNLWHYDVHWISAANATTSPSTYVSDATQPDPAPWHVDIEVTLVASPPMIDGPKRLKYRFDSKMNFTDLSGELVVGQRLAIAQA